jgi:hypothetical protein
MDYNDENRLVVFAKKGFEILSHLAESQKISDKLLGFNGLLVIIVADLLIANYLVPTRDFLTYIILLILFGLFLFAGINFYIPFVGLLANFVEDKIKTLRASIYLLLISLLLATVDIFFNSTLFRDVAVFFLGIQVLIIPFGFMLPQSRIDDIEIPPSKLWGILGNVATVWTIIEMAIFIIGIVKHTV